MKKLYTIVAVWAIVFSSVHAQDKKASLKFDGVDDKVVIPHQSALNLGRSAFTIEAWINGSGFMVSNAVDAPIIFSKKGAGSASMDGILFGLKNTGRMALQMEGQSFPLSGGPQTPGTPPKDLRDGICHHIAWTREVYGAGVDDTVSAFQDAAFVRNTRQPAGFIDISNTEDVWIGASEFNLNPFIYQFEGQIKEIRIWNYAKTESQIWNLKSEHLKGNEAGLLFYWRLNENSGDTAYDCGPSGAHGVISGAVWEDYICDMMDPIPQPNNCVPSSIPTGIEENAASVILIYPNPVINELRFDADVTIDRVMIYDLNGKTVLNTVWNGVDPLNVANLQNGTYMIQLSLRENIVHKTILIKK